jgi:hypothetical protein
MGSMIILHCKIPVRRFILLIRRQGDGALPRVTGKACEDDLRNEIRSSALLLPAPSDRLTTLLLLPVVSHPNDAHRILPRWAFGFRQYRSVVFQCLLDSGGRCASRRSRRSNGLAAGSSEAATTPQPLTAEPNFAATSLSQLHMPTGGHSPRKEKR